MNLHFQYWVTRATPKQDDEGNNNNNNNNIGNSKGKRKKSDKEERRLERRRESQVEVILISLFTSLAKIHSCRTLGGGRVRWSLLHLGGKARWNYFRNYKLQKIT